MRKTVKWVNNNAIFLAIALAITVYFWRGWETLVFYLPFIGLSSALLGEVDLLISIIRGGDVNIKARLWTLTHWLLLVGMIVGSLKLGETSILWFIAQLAMLTIIAFQVGIGASRKWKFSIGDKVSGIIFAILALALGLTAGYFRYADQSRFGLGWKFELIGSIAATVIVFTYMVLDVKTFQQITSGYPRGFFLKEILSNLFVLIFWLDLISSPQADFSNGLWWLRNAGLTFNVLVGNVLDIIRYSSYEYYRYKHKQREA